MNENIVMNEETQKLEERERERKRREEARRDHSVEDKEYLVFICYVPEKSQSQFNYEEIKMSRVILLHFKVVDQF